MRPYVKPQLFFESYELSQHIAACRWDLQYTDENTCYAVFDETLSWNKNEDAPVSDPGNQLFNNNSCDFGPEVLEDYCYHNGAQTSRVFQS